MNSSTRARVSGEERRTSPYSSRSSRPVSETKTSSSVARCVERETSFAPPAVEARRAAPARRRRARRRSRTSGRRAGGSRARRGRDFRSASASAGSDANSTMCGACSSGDELRGRALRDDLAVVDDRDAVAEPLGLVHVVRRQQDRASRRRGSASIMSQSCSRLCGIEARRRLVEEEDLRIADERAGDGEALPLPAGELADPGVALLLERQSASSSSGSRPVG